MNSTEVITTSNLVVSRVAEWCRDHLTEDEWNLEMLNFGPNRWKISFKDEHTKLIALLSH